MITFYIVVLLMGACHCMPFANSTDGNATEPASVEGKTEIIGNATEPPSGREEAEIRVKIPEIPPVIVPPVVSVDGEGTPPEGRLYSRHK